MKNIYIFLILISLSLIANAVSYEKNNSVLNIKYGFKLGDLIEIQDKIITDTKYINTPELIIKKNKDIKLISQTKNISREADKHIFTNKVIYQIYIKSESGNFALPTHEYKINNKNIVMPKKNYWFTRVAESDLNNILLNSINQKKSDLTKVEMKYLYILYGVILLTMLILLYKNFDFPLLERMNGPFAKAHRKIKKLHKKNGKDNYIESILILTDAFNKTFKKNIDSSNYEEIIAKNGKYKEIKGAIKTYINLSSIEIYSSKTFFTKIRFNEIYRFTKILRTIERKV
jgi:mxaA protein